MHRAARAAPRLTDNDEDVLHHHPIDVAQGQRVPQCPALAFASIVLPHSQTQDLTCVNQRLLRVLVLAGDAALPADRSAPRFPLVRSAVGSAPQARRADSTHFFTMLNFTPATLFTRGAVTHSAEGLEQAAHPL
jgi:hypothetical protein